MGGGVGGSLQVSRCAGGRGYHDAPRGGRCRRCRWVETWGRGAAVGLAALVVCCYDSDCAVLQVSRFLDLTFIFAGIVYSRGLNLVAPPLVEKR